MKKDEKFGFDINTLGEPIRQIDITIGTVFLYQITEDVRTLFRSMANEIPENRGRIALARITSLEKRKKLIENIIPIPDEIFSSLTEEDIFSIAELLRKYLNMDLKLPEKDSQSIELKVNGESALAFFDRVIGTYIAISDKDAKVKMKRLIKLAMPPAYEMLEQLNLSSSRLGSTVHEFDKLRSQTIDAPIVQDRFGEMNRRMVQERNDNRKIAILTGEMTKQSAEMLQELVKTAGNFLVQFDERDKKSDKHIKVQLWVALGSLFLSVFLSGLGVLFAAKSYYQDSEKNKADEAGSLIQSERDRKIDRLLDQNNKSLETIQSMQTILKQSIASPRNPQKP